MSECFLYLIASDAPVPEYKEEGLTTCSTFCKVGISRNVKSRLASLQTGSPFRLQLGETWACPSRAAAESFERKIHEGLKKYRSIGEWFLSNPHFIRFVVSDLFCIEAIEAWDMSAKWVFHRLISMGHDPDGAHDTIVANYGEEALA